MKYVSAVIKMHLPNLVFRFCRKIPVMYIFLQMAVTKVLISWCTIRQIFLANFLCKRYHCYRSHSRIKRKNFRIPEDISVISVDDIETAQYLSPHADHSTYSSGGTWKITAKTLIDRINGGHRLPMRISLPFYIAKRDSCGKLNRRRKTFASLPPQ